MTKLFIRPTAVAFAVLVGISTSTAFAEKAAKKMSFGDACKAEGQGPGSDQYKSCINAKIAAYCASANEMNSPEHKACVKDQSSGAFARDMIGRHGY